MLSEKGPHPDSIQLLTWQAVTTEGKIWRISIKNLKAANYRSIHYFYLLHFTNYLNFLQWVLLLSQWKIILLLKKNHKVTIYKKKRHSITSCLRVSFGNNSIAERSVSSHALLTPNEHRHAWLKHLRCKCTLNSSINSCNHDLLQNTSNNCYCYCKTFSTTFVLTNFRKF